MALTRGFGETIRGRIERNTEFRGELLKEGIGRLSAGDVDAGKAVLRDFVDAALGFREQGEPTDKSPESPKRMLGPDGNLQARNLFEIPGRLL